MNFVITLEYVPVHLSGTMYQWFGTDILFEWFHINKSKSVVSPTTQKKKEKKKSCVVKSTNMELEG